MIKFVGISARRSKVLDAAAAERHRVPARQLDLTQVRLKFQLDRTQNCTTYFFTFYRA
jgi:hypothetical protein